MARRVRTNSDPPLPLFYHSPRRRQAPTAASDATPLDGGDDDHESPSLVTITTTSGSWASTPTSTAAAATRQKQTNGALDDDAVSTREEDTSTCYLCCSLVCCLSAHTTATHTHFSLAPAPSSHSSMLEESGAGDGYHSTVAADVSYSTARTSCGFTTNGWRIAWVMLLCCAPWAVIYGAIYSHRSPTSKVMPWFFMWPPLLLAISHLFTWLGFKVYRRRADSITASILYNSSSDPESFWHTAQFVVVVGCAVAGVALVLLFAGLVYWEAPLLGNGQPVDDLPAWGAIATVLMLVTALACRIREVSLLDLEELANSE